ncbi:MAG TPA: UpxY family transcription antiterminator [Candidatus Angelobacter sp.]|jgi:transcription antitermination factor NusG
MWSVKGWFAVQVAPRSEQRVVQHLEYKGYETLVPTYESKRKWRDRTKVLHLPLFPSYVFCRALPGNTGMVLTIPGTVRMVGIGGKPSVIPDHEIEAIQKIGSSGMAAAPYPYLCVGEKVRIAAGPLAGVMGVLSQIRSNFRLIVSVESIMRSISVEIGISDVTPVPKYSPARATPEVNLCGDAWRKTG